LHHDISRVKADAKLNAPLRAHRLLDGNSALNRQHPTRELGQQTVAGGAGGVSACGWRISVRVAYQRTDLLEPRRKLMDAWAAFITRPAADVVPISRGRHTGRTSR
jgi:hypothetical protein